MFRLPPRSVSLALVCACAGLQSSTSGRPNGQPETLIRELAKQKQKVLLVVSGGTLRLKWNGDKGEALNGRGEVYLTTVMTWLTPEKEERDPQTKTIGPLGINEFPSGEIIQTGPMEYDILPAKAGFFERLYENKADCPVVPSLRIHIEVWEQDDATTAAIARSVVAGAINAAVGTAANILQLTSFDDLVNGIASGLVGLFTDGADDLLSKVDTTITFPDPCAGNFIQLKVIPLPASEEFKKLWNRTEPESESGQRFRDPPYNMGPPSEIGSLTFTMIGRVLEQKKSSFFQQPCVGASQHLQYCDLGQPDEATIAGVLGLCAALPFTSAPITYSMFLDVDNNFATGSTTIPYRGADYEMRMQFIGGPTPIKQLLRYDQPTLQFLPVAGGLHDASINIDRGALFFSVKASSLGFPPGPIAAWGVTRVGLAPISVVPVDPAAFAVGIHPNYGPSSEAPTIWNTQPSDEEWDVDRAAPIVIEFSKAMNTLATQSAFNIVPFTPGSITWQGNVMTFAPAQPLNPGVMYHLNISPLATDTVGTPLDGNIDGIPGDPFTMFFRTQHLPLMSCDPIGNELRGFAVHQPVFATGNQFIGPAPAMVYVVRHDPLTLFPGAPLVDATNDGPTPSFIPAAGILPPMHLGSVPVVGEYHVVVDMNMNGVLDPFIDRMDRTGIGMFVQPDCNNNGVRDPLDIINATSTDYNHNGVPDECDCQGDVAPPGGNLVVDIDDLLGVINAWGPCPPPCPPYCEPDIDHNCQVNIDDLLAVITGWGDCS